jgi:hypothetical protein
MRIERRRQFCLRCGQFMFEYFHSPDGHFGLVDALPLRRDNEAVRAPQVFCPACGARYRLLEKLDPTGRPVSRM